MHESGVLYIFAFAFGAVIGSFLNVFIHRWPLEESIVRPGSHCPSCDRPIPWYWNIPVLSWILLRGKCRWCGERISVRYPLVEAITGIWAVVMLYKFGPSVSAVVIFAFGAGLFAASLIDLEHMLLPDIVTIGFIPVGLAMSFIPERYTPAWPVTATESLVGAITGAGLFLVVLLLFKYLTGKEGMGLGDVKLMGSIGAFIGYQGLPPAIMVGGFGGIVAWVWMAALSSADRDRPVPFGPFLSLGAIVVILLREWMEHNWIIIKWM